MVLSDILIQFYLSALAEVCKFIKVRFHIILSKSWFILLRPRKRLKLISGDKLIRNTKGMVPRL